MRGKFSTCRKAVPFFSGSVTRVGFRLAVIDRESLKEIQRQVIDLPRIGVAKP